MEALLRSEINRNARKQAVLRIGKRGWQLFPVRPGQKEPLITDWPNQATNDLQRVNAWIDEFPSCNWGATTGPGSGIVVVDVDGEKGLHAVEDLERNGYSLPKTLTTRTARGKHIFLKCPQNGTPIRNSVGKLAPGVDLRGAGGYVVVPPSIHPSGAAYEFIDESAPIAHAPAWLLSMLTKSSVLAKPTISIETPRPEKIPEGRRNETLFGHAASMWCRGMNFPAVEAALLAENIFCSPPLDEVEVRAIARSASRYEQVAPLARTKVQNGSREWPATLAEEAFHGIAGEFVRLVRPETEADDAALLFSVLVALGSIIGRGPYYEVGGDRHYTNLFAVIVGQSAKARKGTSWGEVRRFVDLVDEHWCKKRVAGGLSSGEGLIDAVRDPITQTVPQREGNRIVGYEPQITDAGVDDKRLLAVESELSQALHSAGRDGNTLSAIVRQAWDGGPLRILAKTAKATCLAPHISILAHITVAELQRRLTSTDMANGFANRFLWICATRSKCLPFGGVVDERALQELAVRTRGIVDHARSIGRVEFAPDAREEWARVYPTLGDGAGVLGAVTARAEPQTLRLALLFSLLDQSPQIMLGHLRAALAMWRYCEDSSRFIFGESLGEQTADKILALLRDNEEGMSRNELTDYFGRNKSSQEIGGVLDLLQSRGLARSERRPTGGRAAEVWKATAVQDARAYEKNEKSPALVRFSRSEKSGDAQTSEPKPPESEGAAPAKDGHEKRSGT